MGRQRPAARRQVVPDPRREGTLEHGSGRRVDAAGLRREDDEVGVPVVQDAEVLHRMRSAQMGRELLQVRGAARDVETAHQTERSVEAGRDDRARGRRLVAEDHASHVERHARVDAPVVDIRFAVAAPPRDARTCLRAFARPPPARCARAHRGRRQRRPSTPGRGTCHRRRPEPRSGCSTMNPSRGSSMATTA